MNVATNGKNGEMQRARQHVLFMLLTLYSHDHPLVFDCHVPCEAVGGREMTKKKLAKDAADAVILEHFPTTPSPTFRFFFPLIKD